MRKIDGRGSKIGRMYIYTHEKREEKYIEQGLYT